MADALLLFKTQSPLPRLRALWLVGREMMISPGKYFNAKFERISKHVLEAHRLKAWDLYDKLAAALQTVIQDMDIESKPGLKELREQVDHEINDETIQSMLQKAQFTTIQEANLLNAWQVLITVKEELVYYHYHDIETFICLLLEKAEQIVGDMTVVQSLGRPLRRGELRQQVAKKCQHTLAVRKLKAAPSLMASRSLLPPPLSLSRLSFSRSLHSLSL